MKVIPKSRRIEIITYTIDPLFYSGPSQERFYKYRKEGDDDTSNMHFTRTYDRLMGCET
jgi:hypothetical protein